MQAQQFFISGKVQGVFFRQSAVDEAARLGLNGFARNLPDGRVEVVASGDAESIAALTEWLNHGPPQASVSQVEQAEIDIALPVGFTVRY